MNALSPWAKLCLGPLRRVRCRVCGQLVSVPFGATLALLVPIIVSNCLLLIGLVFGRWLALAVLSWFGVAILTGYICLASVPLIRRGKFAPSIRR